MKSIKYVSLLACLFYVIQNSTAQETLIHKNEAWNYYDKGYLPETWYLTHQSYPWKTGNAPLGYGDNSLNTEISYGNEERNKELVRYFHKTIQIDQNHVIYGLYVRRDDGVVLYVNGKEVLRNNLPKGELTQNTRALKRLEGVEETQYIFKVLKSTTFKKGANDIAVAVFQASPNSSDLIFDLSLVAFTDSQSLDKIINNTSFNVETNQLNEEITSSQDLFEVQKLKLQNEAVHDTNYALKMLLFLVSCLFFIAIIGYYFMIQNNAKNSRLLSEKLQTLKDQLKEKNTEMLQLSMNVLYNKQYFKELRADIKSIKTDDKSSIKNMMHLLDSVIDRDEEWEQLKTHFNEISSGFYDRLVAKHPSLTETELRHCMFIKMHLQTKEIARILLIDPRSVQTARYRIKKSLELDEEVDLRTYLLSL